MIPVVAFVLDNEGDIITTVSPSLQKICWVEFSKLETIFFVKPFQFVGAVTETSRICI